MSIDVMQLVSIALLAAALTAYNVFAADSTKLAPLVIEAQGSCAAGGKVTSATGTFDPRKPRDSAGQPYRGDHAYAFYQIPVKLLQ